MARRNIMIVENDVIIANDIMVTLTEEGYEICCMTTTGEAALEEAVKHRPDLVIMNVNLQGNMTGIEAADQIVERTRTPIIFLTGYPEHSVMNGRSEAGLFRFVSKPISQTELLSAIEQALSSKQADS